MNIIADLTNRKLINPPKWMIPSLIYVTIAGSTSYGAEDTTKVSDLDVFGVCIPPKNDLFPWNAGLIYGFDEFDPFKQFQQHHVFDQDSLGGKGREYDITIFSIVKFFKLLMDNNPDCIDKLFTSQECILHCTQAGTILRENRKLFLHKGCWGKFKGYSYSMLHKIASKNPQEGSKRYEIREKFSYDVKYAMHLVRALLEVEQILTEGDLDLRRHSEQLKSIRRGEWTIEEIKEWADKKEKQLEEVYTKSALPWGPPKDKIRKLLIECLEIQYQSLKDVIVEQDTSLLLLKEIKEKIEKAGI